MKDYETLLKNAPNHNSPEFLEYLKEHNEVVKEADDFLVIKNFKYHTEEKPHYTAFMINPRRTFDQTSIEELNYLFPDFDILIKAPKRRSVTRFHVHLIV